MAVNEKKAMNFEEALSRLEKIVRELEEGNAPLDISIKLFEEGNALVSFCNKSIDAAERRVKILTEKNGTVTEEDFPAPGKAAANDAE